MNIPTSTSGKSAHQVAHQVALEAGQVLLDNFRVEKDIQFKGRGNIVTNVDFQVEKLSINILRKEYPDFAILAEEGGPSGEESEYTWVLDPLDGTRNYASGNPFFSVNLGLAHKDAVVLGITYDPMRNELFYAEKGKGAYLNDVPISVSRQDSVQMSIVGVDMGYSDAQAGQALALLLSLWPGLQAIRIMGSVALGLAYTAAGRIDIYIHHSIAPWDKVSSLILVPEAGGVITQGDGSPDSIWGKSVIASNNAIHADFLRLSNSSEWLRDLEIVQASQLADQA